MQINLGNILQVTLIILVIAAVVAVVQLIIILVDVRAVTKRVRNAISSVKLLEYFFDGDEAKKLVKKMKKILGGIIEVLGKTIKGWLGGGKNG